MRARLVAIALAGLAALSCGRTYQDLGTFPCAQSHFCPDPMVCVEINGAGLCMPDLTCSPTSAGSCPAGDTNDLNSRARCTVMQTGPGLVEAQCVHESARTLAEGTACEVTYPPPATLGSFAFPIEDNGCANGTLCHSLSLGLEYGGSAPTGTSSGTCRAFCSADSGCTGGERCYDAFSPMVTSATVSVSPAVGVCLPTCTLLPASGNGGCGAGEECKLGQGLAANTGMGICQAPGLNGPEGAYCSGATVCNAGLACVPAGVGGYTCQKLCRVSAGAAACGSGKSCVQSPLALSDADIGLCQ